MWDASTMTNALAFTVEDLRTILEPDLGPLHKLKIEPLGDPSTSKATWSAVNMDGHPVNGGLDVQLEHKGDGTFLLKPIVTIVGASGRLLELPWGAGSKR